MSEKLIRIKSRYDTENNWYNSNPILLDGEIGIAKVGTGASSQCCIKIGHDGYHWNTLIGLPIQRHYNIPIDESINSSKITCLDDQTYYSLHEMPLGYFSERGKLINSNITEDDASCEQSSLYNENVITTISIPGYQTQTRIVSTEFNETNALDLLVSYIITSTIPLIENVDGNIEETDVSVLNLYLIPSIYQQQSNGKTDIALYVCTDLDGFELLGELGITSISGSSASNINKYATISAAWL